MSLSFSDIDTKKGFRGSLNALYSDFYLRGLNRCRGSYRVKQLFSEVTKLGMDNINEKDAEGVFRREWDNLIILDGCRYDIYQSIVSDDVDSRITLGSTSPEYVSKNFDEGYFEDTIYINANAFFYPPQFKEKTGRDEAPSEIFFEFFNTIETDWNDEENTTLPEPLIRDTLTAQKLFSDKKMITHFMQPHHPFIQAEFEDIGHGIGINEGLSIWDRVQIGEVDPEKVWGAYRDNLAYVIEKLNQNLLPKLEGKTLITSDHGNMFGKRGFYGHQEGMHNEELRKVPLHHVDDKIELNIN